MTVRRRLVALTRAVSPAFDRCELSHLDRRPIDVALAERQHAAYEALLGELGCELQRLPAAPELPDSVFVEDTAVVVDELAVIARPGAPSRRGETSAVAAALSRYRPLVDISAPATLDGGDVLRVGRRLFVGLSARTNEAGIAQLTRHLAPRGYEVVGVPVGGCLHLKSAVTLVAGGVLLLNAGWVDSASLVGHERIEVDPTEPFAANALRVADTVVMPAAFPRTRARLEAAGIAVRTVDVSELAKAEGGVTCCSIVLAA